MDAADDSKTVLFAGGGSGGHTYPGLAVAAALVERRPDLRPLFLCTERDIDRVILEPSGFDFAPQPIVPPRRSVGGLLKFWQAWRATTDQVKRTLAERNPVAALGLGGYAAGVAVKQAAQAGVPTAILNPDVIPGKANAYLMRRCRRVFCGFDDTLGHVPEPHRDKCVVVGCPLRPAFASLPDRDAARDRLKLDRRLNTLVVTGASQGAKTVNDATIETFRRLAADKSPPAQGWQVLHLAGLDHAEEVRRAWRTVGMDGRASVVDFTPDMADVWAAADLAVSRAGASTCFELLACGVPAVLLPYPFHKDDHQRANADALAAAGAAVVQSDAKDAAANAASLRPTLESLLYDADRRNRMSAAARAAAKPTAAADVAEGLIALIDE